MLETIWVRVFGTLVFVLPALLGFFAQRDIARNQLLGKPRGNFTLLSVAALFLNISLFYACYIVGIIVLKGQPISDASLGDYKAMLAVRWASTLGILTSSLTIGLALFCERSFARKLFFWGSAIALAAWPLIYLVASEFLADYSLHRN